MVTKIKAFFAAIVIFTGAFFMKLLYGKQIKAQLARDKEVIESNKQKLQAALKEDLKKLSPQEKLLADKVLKLQNELLTVFAANLKEIQTLAKAEEMVTVGQVWVDTTQGLNKTMLAVFAHQAEEKIKEHASALEKELTFAVLTNQEMIGTQTSGPAGTGFGGFGYNGPKGEA